MKTLVTTTIILISIFSAAQTCDCKAELTDFKDLYKNTISYKKQSKDKRVARQFETTYSDLINKIDGNETKWDCFLKLTTLKDVIRDEHSRVRAKGISKGADIVSSDFYKSIPRFLGNVDSLSDVLQTKKSTELEGVYFKGESSYGIYKDQDVFKGIVLESENDLWIKGMQLFELEPSLENNYRLSFINSNFTGMYSFASERFVDGRWIILNIAKDQNAIYHYSPKDTETFHYTQLNSETGYMRIETFSWANNNIEKAKRFIETTFPVISAKNLILDLRNNGGGSDRIGKPMRKALKKYARKNNIYVLVNAKSGSNAEQTTHYLSKLQNVKVLGDRTMGVIAYGLNYGEEVFLNSGNYSFYLTDMNYEKYIDYESRGLPVDVQLSTTSDWIDQTLDIIAE